MMELTNNIAVVAPPLPGEVPRLHPRPWRRVGPVQDPGARHVIADQIILE